MKRIKSNYQHLQVLKTAKRQLRKAIVKNCNSKLVKTISECVLNVIRGNLQLTAYQKRRLREFKVPLRAIADRSESLASKKNRLISVEDLSTSAKCHFTHISQSYISFARRLKMLRKMYLVLQDYLNKNEHTSQSTTLQQKSPLQSTKHKTRVHVKKKKGPQHPYDKCCYAWRNC
jgi:hypothetical protein